MANVHASLHTRAALKKYIPADRRDLNHCFYLSKNVAPTVSARIVRHRRDANVAAAASKDSIYDAVIVGGGLSGLVAGQALALKHGVSNFLVTEACDRVGGAITSVEGNGYMWEEGPNTFQPSDAMLQIAVRPFLYVA